MRKIFTVSIILITLLPLFGTALASVGVGVNLGKIEINEPLKPGGIYNFPNLGVINTGDEPGDYEVAVTYHQDQPQLRPEEEWFNFSPKKFHLDAGESQSVATKLILPVNTRPGEYFAYLEAHPVVESGPGTTIGVAAATKAYFTVAPANIWQAAYYRVASFFSVNAPWSYIVLAALILLIAAGLAKRYLSFQFSIRKKL